MEVLARLAASLSMDWCRPASEKTRIWVIGQSYSVTVISVMPFLAVKTMLVRTSGEVGRHTDLVGGNAVAIFVGQTLGKFKRCIGTIFL